ncbi:MAG: hypothetical protein ABIS17_05245 [Casimicrobiaceae bacterium]
MAVWIMVMSFDRYDLGLDCHDVVMDGHTALVRARQIALGT